MPRYNDPADAADRSGRHRRLDRRDPVARDKHIAELEAIGIAGRPRHRSIIASRRGG